MKALRGHLAAAAKTGAEEEIFDTIINLNVGEALLFAPAAMLDFVGGGESAPGDDDRHDEGGNVKDEAEDDEDKNNKDNHNNMINDSTERTTIEPSDHSGQTPRKLGVAYVKVRIRDRLTVDGGRSLYAVPHTS